MIKYSNVSYDKISFNQFLFSIYQTHFFSGCQLEMQLAPQLEWYCKQNKLASLDPSMFSFSFGSFLFFLNHKYFKGCISNSGRLLLFILIPCLRLMIRLSVAFPLLFKVSGITSFFVLGYFHLGVGQNILHLDSLI